MTPDSLLLDLRHAWRGLRRSPGLAVTAILTLALGIGANVTIFSVVDAAMLKPLPYEDPEQLVNLLQVYRPGTPEETTLLDVTSWNWLDRWRGEPQIFSAIATYSGSRPVTIEEGAPPGIVRVAMVSPDLLPMLGVAPRLGRWFAGDDVAAGGAVVLLSERFWRRTFDGDPGVLGRTLTVDGRPHAIIGVMPDTFGYGIWHHRAATAGWIPFDEAEARRGPRSSFYTMMRLRPGLTLSQAEREVRAVDERMRHERPAASSWSVELSPLDSRATNATTRIALMVFSGAVAFVLLVACANVANLLLCRVLTRQREIAVRAALGASRSRIVRLVLAEGLVLAAIGTSAAVAIAWWASRMLPAVAPETLALFEANAIAIDWRVLGYSAFLMTVTTVLCALAPALRATRANVAGALDGRGKIAGSSRPGRRLWQGLQASQVLFTVILLTGAGLLANSFMRMMRADLGYDADGLVGITLDVPRDRYADRVARLAVHDQILRRIATLPGVVGATYGQAPPNGGGGRLFIEGREQESSSSPQALSLYGVGHDYFAIAGIPIKQGRGFTADEARSSAKVTVIDERLAATWWPGESPLGKQVRFGVLPVWNTVVGVAGSVKTQRFAAPAGSVQAYHPSTGLPWLLVRAVNPDEVTRLARKAVEDIDPALDVSDASRVTDLYEESFVAPRFYSALMLIFGGMALATAAVGLFAVVSYSTAQRRREIGVRLALGAQLGQIRRLVMKDALAPLAVGMAAGLVVAFWTTRYLEALLYQVTPHDPATYAAVLTFLAVVAGAAALIPARRAARLDPLQTLREQWTG